MLLVVAAVMPGALTHELRPGLCTSYAMRRAVHIPWHGAAAVSWALAVRPFLGPCHPTGLPPLLPPGPQGLMFMPNIEAALREFVRVLKPGGLFVATVWQGEEEVRAAAHCVGVPHSSSLRLVLRAVLCRELSSVRLGMP